MRIVWNAICTSVGKGLINDSLLDVKDATDLVDIEPLLVE